MYFTERERTHTHTIFRERAHAHTPYILQRESARAHTHHIFYTEHARTHTIYFTGEETMQKHSYAHIHTAVINRKKTACKVRAPHLRKPLGLFGCKGLKCMWPSSITAAFPLQLRRSRAYTKCQCMDLLLAQRSMIRTKQRMYISTHAPYILQRARTNTPYLEREHAQYLEREHAHHI